MERRRGPGGQTMPQRRRARSPSGLTLMWALGLGGCAAKPACEGEGPGRAGSDVVQLQTDDGLCLAADLIRAEPGAPAVVLLHMTPLSWDRGSWPTAFLDELAAAGAWVLNVDRRGAGGSEGEPEDAFFGEGGRLDVAAAAARLDAEGAGALHLVAASNGTTSALDYAVWALGGGAAPPAGLLMLTGGDYTENQTPLSALAASGTPLTLVYAADEAAWSDAQRGLDPGGWSWDEAAPTGHGTHLFEEVPGLGARIVDHLGLDPAGR